MAYYGNEASRWDYADIKRIRRSCDKRPIPLPRADKTLRQLGHGLQFTHADGSVVAVQVWDHAPAVNQWWAVVYAGASFPGEMRVLTLSKSDEPSLSGTRYRPNGHRAHADGVECLSSYPCKDCWA